MSQIDTDEYSIVISGSSIGCMSSLTITGLPEFGKLLIHLLIKHTDGNLMVYGDVPDTINNCIPVPFWRRVKYFLWGAGWRRTKYDIKRERKFTFNSPNGLPFDAEWIVYKENPPKNVIVDCSKKAAD